MFIIKPRYVVDKIECRELYDANRSSKLQASHTVSSWELENVWLAGNLVQRVQTAF